MGQAGFILRSGGAQGADLAFESGAAEYQREIFLPWRGFNGICSAYYQITQEAIQTAWRFHPSPRSLSAAAVKLMERNVYQVLGEDLKTPSLFVICWTPAACLTQQHRTQRTGGTGQAISIATAHNVPVYNLADRVHYEKFVEVLGSALVPKPFEKLFPKPA